MGRGAARTNGTAARSTGNARHIVKVWSPCQSERSSRRATRPSARRATGLEQCRDVCPRANVST
eukprot:1851077-Lingulodinium_polyedra.AAC.1